MALEMDQLMLLTEYSAAFDKIKGELRKAGKNDQADKLLKFQQDAGIELEKAFGIYDPSAGPQTAALDKAYKEITLARLSKVLRDTQEAFPAGAVMHSLMGAIIDNLLPPEASSVAAPQRKTPRV